MNISKCKRVARRGAVATVLVLIVIGLLMGLVAVGLDTVRRSRRVVRSVDDQQVKRWERVAGASHHP